MEVLEFLVDNPNHVKAMSVVDRVDEDVTVDTDGIFGRKERVLVLAGGVDDGDVVFNILVVDLFEIGLFNGRVIWFDELALYKLYNKRGFACV